MIESRTTIITGAASGIGLETVRRFSEDSKYKPIYAADFNPSLEIIFPKSEYPNVVPIQVDVGVREQLEGMLKRVASESARLDLVVNAAGVMYKGKPAAFRDKNRPPPREWEEMDRVNLWAPIISLVMIRETLPRLFTKSLKEELIVLLCM